MNTLTLHIIATIWTKGVQNTPHMYHWICRVTYTIPLLFPRDTYNEHVGSHIYMYMYLRASQTTLGWVKGWSYCTEIARNGISRCVFTAITHIANNVCLLYNIHCQLLYNICNIICDKYYYRTTSQLCPIQQANWQTDWRQLLNLLAHVQHGVMIEDQYNWWVHVGE